MRAKRSAGNTAAVRTVRAVLPVFLALSLALGAGCGKDEDPQTLTPPLEFQIRPGTWDFDVSFQEGGAALCDTSGTLEAREILCAFDPDADTGADSLGPMPGVAFICTGEWDGAQVSFSCSRSLDAPACRLTEIFQGGGAMTDTTMDLVTKSFFTWTALQPENQAGCDFLAPPFLPCTTRVELTGQWISSAGDTACQDTGAPRSMVPFESLLPRVSGWRDR